MTGFLDVKGRRKKGRKGKERKQGREIPGHKPYMKENVTLPLGGEK